MNQVIISFILLAFILTNTCCQKRNESAAYTPQGKLLTSAPWKKVAATVKPEGQTEEDTYTGQLPCEKDNLYIFSKDGYYVTDHGAVHCPGDGDEPHDKKTRWNISEDGKMMLIIEAEDLGGAEFPYQIEILNSTTLKIKHVLDKLTVTETYSH